MAVVILTDLSLCYVNVARRRYRGLIGADAEATMVSDAMSFGLRIED